MTSTAQTITQVAQAASAGVSPWIALLSAIAGLFGGIFISKKAPGATNALKNDASAAIKGAAALAPVAEQVAVLAGQPQTAAGIAAAQEITTAALKAVSSSNTVLETQAIVNLHAQALAAVNGAPAPAPASAPSA